MNFILETSPEFKHVADNNLRIWRKYFELLFERLTSSSIPRFSFLDGVIR